MKDVVARRRMIIAFGGAILSTAAARAMVPTRKLSEEWGRLDLEKDVPRSFDGWALQPQQIASIVSPDQQALLNEVYSQVLSRTYVDKDGYKIMLAIAYGGDKRNALQTHYPEVCYPGQGFKIRSREEVMLEFPEGKVPVKRLDTALGEARVEPVTYWAMIGDQPELSGLQRRLGELRFVLQGLIPDGLLFRVSSIDTDTQAAYAKQDEFIKALLAHVAPNSRKRLAGF